MADRRAHLPGVDVLFGQPVRPPRPAPADQSVPAVKPAVTKYTLLLDSDAIRVLLADEAELTRRMGKTPTRSALFRALLVLLHEDDDLMDRAVAQVRKAAAERAALLRS